MQILVFERKMSSVLFRSIQAYYRVWSNTDIQAVCRYVNSKINPNPVFPNGSTPEQRQRMVERFQNNWFTQRQAPSMRLFYRPNARIDLEVIPIQRRFTVLNAFYANPSLGAIQGQDKIFQQVVRHFIGIPKRMCDAF
jgi:hypothetical protein